MFGSYQLIFLIKLILFEALELMCNEDGSFRPHHQPISSNDSDMLPGTPFITVISVSIDDHFAVVNCSTKKRVPHHELEWYFRKSNSHKSPRVIWQRGRSNIHRYHAYSPDQLRHYLQIKPVQLNDSGSYICIDQMTGFQDTVELVVRDSRSCAGCIMRLQIPLFICLMCLSSILSRRMASESKVT